MMDFENKEGHRGLKTKQREGGTMGAHWEDEAVFPKGRMKMDSLNQYQLPRVEKAIPGNHASLVSCESLLGRNWKGKNSWSCFLGVFFHPWLLHSF